MRLQLRGFFQPAHQDEAHGAEINANLHLFRVSVVEFKTKQLSRQSERNLTAVQTRTRTHTQVHAPGVTLNSHLSPPASVCCLDGRQCQECVSVSPRCQCPRKQAARAAGERGSNNNKHESAPPTPGRASSSFLLHHLCQKSCGCHRRLIRQSEMEKMLTRRLSSVTQNKRGRGERGSEGRGGD